LIAVVKVDFINQHNIIMNEQAKQPRVEPVTIEEKLEDLRRRLGRMEKLLIDMRGNRSQKSA
jgi:CMP-2-keto-3-deoxyoctulosonic acid synthetase